jgi:DNA-binding NarL/FixJ family response regulator
MKQSPELPHNMAQQAITIVLADDHTMMREGTRRLLEEDPALVVIGEAGDGIRTIELCQQLQPDILVLDIAMKGLNGFAVAQTLLAEPDGAPAILILTGYDQPAYVQAMLQLGIKGYWLKSASGHEIRQALHEVATGKRSLAPEIRQMLNEEETSPYLIEPLTNREREVLQQVVQGLRNGEIAEQLHVSVKTVETHLTSLYGKLGVQSRAEAIALAQKQGLLLEAFRHIDDHL